MTTGETRAQLCFEGYQLDNVYEQVSSTLVEEIIALWLDNRVVDEAEARRRTAEVVLTIRDGNGTLVGVNSVYIQDFIKANTPYYFYRVFIRPKDRRSFGLRSFAGKAAREFLRNYTPIGHPKPQGVVIVVENRKLARPGAQRMLARQGWTRLGKGSRGYDVWFDKFGAPADTPPHNV